MSEQQPALYWESPYGTPVSLVNVDEERLAALYASESAAEDFPTSIPSPDAQAVFDAAWEAANLATRHAWRCGYKNPRTAKDMSDGEHAMALTIQALGSMKRTTHPNPEEPDHG